MGQILSNSEVEAVLAALDFSGAPPSTSSQASASSQAGASADNADVSLYDFEHPVPLRPSQLEGLRLASAATCESIRASLTSVLRSPVAVNFLAVEQSTFRDYLVTTERPACLAEFESQETNCTCLLDISRSLAFTMIDCLLGGQPSATQPTLTLARPFSEVETRLIDKAIRTILPELLGDLSSHTSMRMTRLVSDGSLIPAATSNEAVALVSFEVRCGLNQGLMQLCIPWKQVAQTSSAVSLEKGELREIMRSGAIKVPLLATARIATLKLSTRELAGLTPGDILLTDASPTSELCLEVGGHEIFRGMPGQSHDRKVVRLTSALVTSRLSGCSDDNSTELRSGSGYS